MADKELMRFTLTLNMDIPLHKQVWEILSGIQRGSRTEYVCKKIIGQDELGKIVYENTLKAMKDYGGSMPQVAVAEQNMSEAEEIENNLFGFLASLE